MNFFFRKATLNDTESLEILIALSAKSINTSFYTHKEVAAALGSAWGVDKQLILDKTYWIVENLEAVLIGCGGWSKRNLLFGKNDAVNTLNNALIPGKDAARIRAFFVHPDYVRKGIGKALLQKCEMEAHDMGFTSLELVATLSGEKLYAANGYIVKRSYEVDLGNGVTNKVIAMEKIL